MKNYKLISRMNYSSFIIHYKLLKLKVVGYRVECDAVWGAGVFG